MWPHIVNLFFRVLHTFFTLFGTTALGWGAPLLDSVLSIGFALFFILRREGKQAMVRRWKQDAAIALRVVFWVTLCIYGPIFLYSIARTIYDDHQSLAAEVRRLKTENADLRSKTKQDELKRRVGQALSEAQHWQDAYERISRGEVKPDRILNRQETDALFQELSRLSKDPKNKQYATLDFGTVPDREAQHLATQLFQTMTEAHCHVTWKQKPSKEIQETLSHTLPLGVTIWTDQPNNTGAWLSGAFTNAGLQTFVNPAPIPPNFKGTLVWVGYKQFP